MKHIPRIGGIFQMLIIMNLLIMTVFGTYNNVSRVYKRKLYELCFSMDTNRKSMFLLFIIDIDSNYIFHFYLSVYQLNVDSDRLPNPIVHRVIQADILYSMTFIL